MDSDDLLCIDYFYNSGREYLFCHPPNDCLHRMIPYLGCEGFSLVLLLIDLQEWLLMIFIVLPRTFQQISIYKCSLIIYKRTEILTIN